jgi:hypothetical protein
MLFKLAGRHRIKRLGPFTFKIDRPKGYVKTWGSKSFTYPCDYGYFPGVKGEDGEALDAFVGDDLSGRMESFLKLKKDQSGNLVPDETKFLVGVSDKDAKKIYALYGDEVSQRVTYESVDDLKAAVKEFKPMKKKRYESVEEKTATPRYLQELRAMPQGPERKELEDRLTEAFFAWDDKPLRGANRRIVRAKINADPRGLGAKDEYIRQERDGKVEYVKPGKIRTPGRDAHLSQGWTQAKYQTKKDTERGVNAPALRLYDLVTAKERQRVEATAAESVARNGTEQASSAPASTPASAPTPTPPPEPSSGPGIFQRGVAGFKKLPRSTQALMVTPAALLSAYGLYRGGKAMVDHFSPREEETPTKLAAIQALERFGIKAASAKTADLYKKLLGEIMARKRGKPTEKLGAAELAYKLAPSLANAYDAYQATSAALEAQKQQEERMRFPALHATQPERMMNSMYAMDPSSTGSFDSPPVHHRRHRRHHH